MGRQTSLENLALYRKDIRTICNLYGETAACIQINTDLKKDIKAERGVPQENHLALDLFSPGILQVLIN